MKQALFEALAAFTRRFETIRLDVTADGRNHFMGSLSSDEFAAYNDVIAAARLVERLLPGVCTDCGGRVEKSEDLDYLRANWLHCSSCDGSGRVWDEGIVEAVAEAIGEDFLYPDPHNEGNWMGPGIQASKQVARVVLSVLVELLTEKVET